MKPIARKKGKDSRKSKKDRFLLPEETLDDKDEKEGDTESEMDDVEDDDDKIDNF